MNELIINQRAYSTFLPLKEELTFNKEKNYFFPLDYLSIINVEGARANEFLQGQLTCDINLVSPTAIQQGAYCNLKGRVQILLDVINWQGFKLILPADLIEETLMSLNKTAMLSRVKLLSNTDYRLYGFYLSPSNNTMSFTLPKEKELLFNEFGLSYSLDKQRFLFLIPEEYSTHFLTIMTQTADLRGSLAWHYLQLEREYPEIYPNTRNLFLPHRIDLPKKGFISFNKGCYKGQEIIARTHYRATQKHRFKQWIISTEMPISAGDVFINTSGQELGELIDYCPLGDNQFLILASLLENHPNEVFLKDTPQKTIFLLTPNVFLI